MGFYRLRAASHLVTGRVTSMEKLPDLQLLDKSQGDTKTVDLGDPDEKDGIFYYRFGHQAAPHVGFGRGGSPVGLPRGFSPRAPVGPLWFLPWVARWT